MPEFDVAIRGGTVVDGTRNPRQVTDIGIKDGKVAKIGKLNPSDAKKTLDASGLVVAPGFVDLHTHALDLLVHLQDPFGFLLDGLASLVGKSAQNNVVSHLHPPSVRQPASLFWVSRFSSPSVFLSLYPFCGSMSTE